MRGTLPPSNTLLLHTEPTIFTYVSIQHYRQDLRNITMPWLLFVSARSVNTERRKRRRGLPVLPHVSTRNTAGQILTKFDTESLTQNCRAIWVFINVNKQKNIIPDVTSRYEGRSPYRVRTPQFNVKVPRRYEGRSPYCVRSPQFNVKVPRRYEGRSPYWVRRPQINVKVPRRYKGRSPYCVRTPQFNVKVPRRYEGTDSTI